MKKLIALFAMAVISTALFAQESAPAAEVYATVKWDKTVHNFGKIDKSQPAVAVFKLTNVGNVPFTILGIERPSDCAMPEWPVKPLQPGETGVFKISYQSVYGGFFNKVIRIKCNVKETYLELNLTGEAVGDAKTR